MTKDARFQRALLDPVDVFETPEDVRADEGFTREQKIEILRRWEYDASEISVAEDEGMPARNGDVLQQVFRALDDLGAEIDDTRRPPTKQGGLDRQAVTPGKPGAKSG
jgi:hypothetical protein